MEVVSTVDEARRSTDNRNVLPQFKGWLTEDIRANLDESRSELVVIFQNVQGDFNIATGIRNSLWFNTSGCWIFGRRRYDKRGTVGAHHYIDVNHAETFPGALETLRGTGYRIVAAELSEGAVSLSQYQWQSKTALVFGEENAGLSQETLDLCDDVVFIPGRGSIRSLNVGTASGIMLYDYHAKLNLFDD